MVRYAALFSPLSVGGMELRNRLVMTGHTTGMASDHMPGEQLRAYYRERARGGVAMIISEASSVHPTAAHMNQTIFLYDPRIVDSYKVLTKELHELGCRFIAQLWHCGTNTDGMKTEMPVWGPSPLAGVLNHELAHEMSRAEIEEMVDAYARAAAYAREGGADGVELHMAHGYLLQQFMSPFTNKRTDEYGGDLEGRMRFPLAVLAAVREAVGQELIVGARLSGEEGVPGGLELLQNLEIAKMLATTKAVSYFSISFGNCHNMEIQTAPMGMPAGHLTHLAGAVRAQVDVPILAVGRILTPDVAEAVLSSGQADLIGMARELIADPQFGTKAESAPATIRQCIGCNYCQSRVGFGKHVTCIYNAAAGRERELGAETLTPVAQPKRILVIGGGPGGLEAARVAALRGHEVTLYERAPELGGQIRLAARVKSREEIANVVRFLSNELRRLEVDVQLETDVTPELIDECQPDAVILATGSRARAVGMNALRSDVPGIPGIETCDAVTPRDVLDESRDVGQNVLVVDFEGHVQGMATAEHLLDQGKQVEIVTAAPFLGMAIGGTSWIKLMQDVSGKGVKITTDTMVDGVEGRTVKLVHVYGGGTETREGIDTIVVVGDAVSEDHLGRELEVAEAGYRVISVGDCVAPRHLDMAVLEGHRAGRAV